MRSFIVLSTLSFLMKVYVLVEGRYFVEVRLNGYTNPSGQCEDCEFLFGWIQTCCDIELPPEILPPITTNDCTGEGRCDSYFNYCLRPFGNGQLDGCSPSEYTTSSINSNDGPLNFSQSTVLGLSNPLVLSGLRGAYQGVQVYVEILDEDTITLNDLVDLLLIDHNQSIAQPLRQNHTGVHMFVTMDLTITVVCAETFQGSDCTQCVPGLTGPDCNETDHCSGVSCGDNGVCKNVVNSFQCMCDPGFTGMFCETNNDDCVGVDCTGNVDIDASTSEASGRDNTVDDSDTTANSARGGARDVSAIAGGVAGALLFVAVLLILVIAIVIILKHYNNRREVNKGSGNGDPLPGDNPVYEQGNTTSDDEHKGDSSLNTRTPVTTLPEEEGIENGGGERNFDNFIYGDDDDDERDDGDHVYMAPFDQQDQQSSSSHEFDNPIYGTETSDS